MQKYVFAGVDVGNIRVGPPFDDNIKFDDRNGHSGSIITDDKHFPKGGSGFVL
jgi:hypothetical protein